jgi:hypothetical protein
MDSTLFSEHEIVRETQPGTRHGVGVDEPAPLKRADSPVNMVTIALVASLCKWHFVACGDCALFRDIYGSGARLQTAELRIAACVAVTDVLQTDIFTLPSATP